MQSKFGALEHVFNDVIGYYKRRNHASVESCRMCICVFVSLQLFDVGRLKALFTLNEAIKNTTLRTRTQENHQRTPKLRLSLLAPTHHRSLSIHSAWIELSP